MNQNEASSHFKFLYIKVTTFSISQYLVIFEINIINYFKYINNDVF